MNFHGLQHVKYAAAGLALTAALFGGGEANAGVNWAIGINVPSVVISEPAPVYYQPAPLYATPAPIYHRQGPPPFYPPPPPP